MPRSVYNEATVIAALSIAGPIYRVGGGNLPKLIEAVKSAGRLLSAALGYQQAFSAVKGRNRT
ncbi:MAG: hypothetical protein ABJF23_24100 [Bryobacteraceae bacterium]